ncbi:hypothetical protein VSS74_24210 [Conexibacter stalactiti]|uniref:MarR family transcriptional regulator n=1 Tax=Conexibacter stalactiti TaxID=1940611 RepID=A0ABU4HVX1_9ACTN|nr:hypothetical protein [Conexibacter stalactiti]MDW5597475.1 hypothetical protein [Conexibacter stalactiti]MEC5038117.1 hypothetical protein [Conexibacter stalactiti]
MSAATDAELAYVDQVGRYFARQYNVPPVSGRVCGWLLICEPPEQTAAEIAEALGISRSAVGSAVTMLENWTVVQRRRPPGERADKIGVHAAFGEAGLVSPAEYGALRALAVAGLELLRDSPPARRTRLLEMVAFTDFLLERLPALAEEWRARRDALRASGALPHHD